MNLITTTHTQPMTTSLVIAEKFGKRHDSVLRAIRNLECPSDFAQRNFVECFRINELANGKPEPYYAMTRDGFAFLAMGFTGKKAAEWKVKFLQAFNDMERALRQQQAHRVTAQWLEARSNGKVARISFTDNIQEFIGYAKAQGSKNAEKYYMQLTKMESQALFLIGKAVGEEFRNRLSTSQLITLSTAEIIAQRALREGMNSSLHYKAIYQLAKQRVQEFAAMVGKSLPGANDSVIQLSA